MSTATLARPTARTLPTRHPLPAPVLIAVILRSRTPDTSQPHSAAWAILAPKTTGPGHYEVGEVWALGRTPAAGPFCTYLYGRGMGLASSLSVADALAAVGYIEWADQ